jgi:hypothetical protein
VVSRENQTHPDSNSGQASGLFSDKSQPALRPLSSLGKSRANQVSWAASPVKYCDSIAASKEDGMATEMKIWCVSDQKKLELVQDVPFAANHLEKDLESWIENSPDVLGEDLLVIARQHQVPGIGILDLLCLDGDGAPVIVELKRNSTPCEAIAQALDYASWLDTQSKDELKALAESSLKRNLEEAFKELFQDELPEIDCQNHRIILVAPKLDASAERIINYPAERYRIRINAVFFKYAIIAGQEILVRSMLVSDEVTKPRRAPREGKVQLAPEELEKVANERKVSELVNICREMHTFWDESSTDYFPGSWRYSKTAEQGWRSLVRVDVTGNASNTPVGELDVWVRCKNVAEVTGIDEATIRSTLKSGYSVLGEKIWQLRYSPANEG